MVADRKRIARTIATASNLAILDFVIVDSYVPT
jgi:hypothetical protein